MPCRYYTDAEEAEIAATNSKILRNELDKVTRCLCEVMEAVESANRLKKPKFKVSPEVSDWWENHKRMDKALRKIEREVQEKEKQALKERKALEEAKEKELLAELKAKYEK
jgi:hypothetical protein